MDLSRVPVPTNSRIGAGIAALPLELDDDGTMPGKMMMMQGRGAVATPDRSQFVDAVTLVEMIRQVVREELERLLTDWAALAK